MAFFISINDSDIPYNTRDHKGKSLIAFPSDYCIVDLETTGLYPAWDDIIEIGAIRYTNNKEADRFQTLVRPPIYDDGTYIAEFIEELTGITNEMLSNAPEPVDALRAFDLFLGNSLIVGYNTNFDINFLYDNYDRFLSKPFTNNFIDVMRFARKLHPELSHHRLIDMISLFSPDYKTAHRSIADCEATALCYDRLCKEAIQQFGGEKQFADQYNKRKFVRSNDIKGDLAMNDPDNPIYQRHVVITGKLEKFTRSEVMKLISDIGGINEDTVTKKTNYLVLGNNDYCATIKDGKSSKQKKAEAYKLKGQEIDIIPEEAFYDMIADYIKERDINL